MEGLVRIEEYRVSCIVGVHPEERHEEQELFLDIELRFNMLEVAQTDSLVDTINYEEVGRVCAELAKKRRYHLLETFAYEALHALLDTFPPLVRAKVAVKKPGALPQAKHVVIEMEKKR